MQLTPRGQKVFGITGLFAMLMLAGLAGYIETLP